MINGNSNTKTRPIFSFKLITLILSSWCGEPKKYDRYRRSTRECELHVGQTQEERAEKRGAQMMCMQRKSGTQVVQSLYAKYPGSGFSM